MSYALGQKFTTVDLAKALLHEHGVFEAISPNGEIYKVECRPDSSIASLTSQEQNGVWMVTKIAERPVEETPRARAAGAGR